MGFIDKFKDLGKELLMQFMAARMRKKPSGYLLTLQQRNNETLKKFMGRFNLEKMAFEDHTNDMVFTALY
jgi:hypothetical protein